MRHSYTPPASASELRGAHGGEARGAARAIGVPTAADSGVEVNMPARPKPVTVYTPEPPATPPSVALPELWPLLQQVVAVGTRALRALIRDEVAAVLDEQSPRCRLLTDEQVCHEVLGVGITTLRTRLIPDGIPHVMVGDVRRWDPDEVLQWLRKRPAANG